MNFIPKGDVYRLIARSRLPEAAKFERWVFDEVLPSIRATGGYNMDMQALVAQTAAAVVTEFAKQILPLFQGRAETPIEEDFLIIDDESAPRRRPNRAMSTISRLEVGLRREIEEMIFSDRHSYVEIAQHLSGYGIIISPSSICRYRLKMMRTRGN